MSIPLVAARAYSLDQFRSLMHEGKAVDDRDLGLMRQIAEWRFSQFTDEEVDHLHAWLVQANVPLEDVPQR